jgi:predicted dehydrogenase
VETYSGKLGADVATETIDVSTEDYGCVMLRFESGSRGVMWVSQVTAGRKNCLRFELAGSKQSLSWTSETPNEIEIGHRDEPNQKLFRDPALMGTRAAGASSYPGGHNEGFGDTFKQLFADFYQSIEAGEFRDQPSFPTFEDGHHEILVCEAILDSHRQERWIKVGENET